MPRKAVLNKSGNSSLEPKKGVGKQKGSKVEVGLRYRALVEQIPAIIYTYSPEGNNQTLYINPQVETITGYTADEWIADNSLWVNMLHPLDRGRVVAENARANKTSRPFKSEYRIVTRDGQLKWVREEAQLIRDRSGKILFWQGFIIDITERKQAEAALQDAGVRYRALVEQIPAVVYTDSAESTDETLYINPQIEMISGYSPEEWMEDIDLWINIIHMDDRERVIEANIQSNETGKPFNLEYRIITRDGQIKWLHDEALLICDPSGKPLFWQGFMMDITERKQNEAALHAAGLLYRSLVEQIPAIIYTDSAETIFQTLYVNPQVEMITGYTPEEWMSSNDVWINMLHPDDRKRVLDENTLAYKTGEMFKDEYRIVTRAGQIKWLHDESRLIHDPSGKPLFWQGIIVDITERKQAEIELQRRAEELSALQEAVLNITLRHSLHDLLSIILESAARLFHVINGAVYLAEPEMRRVRCVVSLHPAMDLRGTVLEYGDGVAGMVAETGKPLIIDNYSILPGRAMDFEGVPPPSQALISAPMLWQGQVSGVLLVMREEKFLQADLDLLVLFANHAATAVENARLYESVGQELAERKRAEEALRESEAIYRQSIESAGAVPYYQSYSADRVHVNYDFISAGIYQITGYKPEEFTTELWDSLVQETSIVGDLAKYSWDEAIQKARSSESPIPIWKCEYRIQARDGKTHWVYESAVELRDKNGVAHGSVGLFRDITEQKRAEQVQEAIYRISQAVVTTTSLDELYHSIHNILGKLMSAENFYIALYDQTSDLLSFPYYVDQYDQPPPPAKPQRGCTEYVLRTKKPLWASREVFAKLIQQGEVEVVGSDSVDWIGVPLKVEERVTGVMVTQSYTEGIHFNQEDVDLFEFVSTQVALAIERKKAEDALRESLQDTQEHAEHLALLNRITRAVSTTLNLDDLLEIIHGEIVTAIPADSFFVALYNSETNELDFRIREDRGVREPPHARPLGTALTAQVVNTKKYLLIQDYQLEKDHLPAMGLWGTGEPSRSWLGVPMILGEKVVGVISIQSYSRNVFGENEQQLLSTIADTVAVAIENARLYAAEQQRATRLTQMMQLGIELASLREEEKVLDTLVRRVAEIMESTTCTVMLIDAVKNEAVLTAQFGLPENAGELYVPLTLPVIRQMIESGEPLILTNIDRDNPMMRKVLVRPDIQSFFAYPMVREGRVIGILTLSYLIPTSPSVEEISACHLLVERAAAALENARLFDETARHLQNVQALRTIDAAIASSLDLHGTLNIILTQIVTQLGADAADVFLFNPHAHTLEFASGRGFRSNVSERSKLLLGEGPVGKLVLEHQTVHIPDLAPVIKEFVRAKIFSSEGFVTYTGTPLIAKGEVKGVLEVFHRTPYTSGEEWLEFMETLAGQVAIAIDNSQLFNNLQHSNIELSLAYEATIEGWSRALDLRDRETEGHTQRVTEVTVQLARLMGMNEAELVHVRRGILLHDMGKMGIPDTILLKPGPLSDEEWETMRKHPQYAFEMLAPITYLRPALDIPGCHHEKWDGTGYPRRLKGEQIPLAARVFAVVDVYDALTSDRPYRKAWSKEKAIQYILDESGKHFDPKVVEVFMELRQKLSL